MLVKSSQCHWFFLLFFHLKKHFDCFLSYFGDQSYVKWYFEMLTIQLFFFFVCCSRHFPIVCHGVSKTVNLTPRSLICSSDLVTVTHTNILWEKILIIFKRLMFQVCGLRACGVDSAEWCCRGDQTLNGRCWGGGGGGWSVFQLFIGLRTVLQQIAQESYFCWIINPVFFSDNHVLTLCSLISFQGFGHTT